MSDLFEAEKGFQPLADRMRPRKLDQVFGHRAAASDQDQEAYGRPDNSCSRVHLWTP